MPEIIALAGPLRTGKSLTLEILYDELLKKDFSILIDRKIPDSKDFTAIFQKNNTKVGVASGYHGLAIKKQIDALINKGCNIMVCTCFLKGKNREVLETYQGFDRVVISKTVAKYKGNRIRANLSDARNILAEIEKKL